ncbi:MAG: hypothetical protein QOF78_1034 [Phycisphaerales bacterium]|jgi:hypothetical protein|nr:hypothetical protein [Phycisphaerales bacterium]
MSNPPPSPPPSAPAEVDEELLREWTGQTEVSDPNHARALLGIAQREEADARKQHERTRWPLRKARFRMLPVTLRMPPLVASVVLSSAIIFAVAMLLIVVRLAGTVELIALISVGYTLGFGVILYFLNDGPKENDDNRAAIRRRDLQAAIDARVASAAKVMRLERETRARQELLERVITFSFESARRRRQQAAKESKNEKPSRPPLAKSDPPEPEYGGG